MERITLTVTTDGSGDATVFSAGLVRGEVLNIRYVPDGTAPLATGADTILTGEATGTAIWTGTNIGTSAFAVAPRQATHDTVGAASLYAAGGEPVEAPIAIAGERLKLVVAQGGATKIGVFHVVMSGSA